MLETAEASRSSSSASVEICTFYVNPHPSFAKGCSVNSCSAEEEEAEESVTFSKSSGKTF